LLLWVFTGSERDLTDRPGFRTYKVKSGN
jgi:hypothetical protein